MFEGPERFDTNLTPKEEKQDYDQKDRKPRSIFRSFAIPREDGQEVRGKTEYSEA